MSNIDIDHLIDILRRTRTCDSSSKISDVSEEEIACLCARAKEIFRNQPILLQLRAPIKIWGNINGQYQDFLRMLEFCGFPPDSQYLFLGNYIDRGRQSIESICLLLAYKIKYPERIFLLRGNHECASMNRIYGFFDECKRRYSLQLWKVFNDCFNYLPVVAIVNEKIFCCHGGLSPELHSLNQIREIQRPTDVPDGGLLCDLLWADPDETLTNWNENDVSISSSFGINILTQFLERYHLELFCRSHEVVEKGFKFYWDRKLVTIFSAPNYCGEFRNDAAIMCVDDHLLCSFMIFPPNKGEASHTDQNRDLTKLVNRKSNDHIAWVDIEYPATDEKSQAN